MKYIILTLLVFSFVRVTAQDCVQASHAKAAESLLISMQTPKTLKEGINSMMQMQIQSNPSLKAYENIFNEFFAKYMNFERLKEPLIKLYTDEFSEAELNDMIAFYETPTGKKLADRQGALTSKAAQLGQEAVRSHLSELEEMIKKAAEK